MEELIGNVTDATIQEYIQAPAAVVVFGIANCEGCTAMDGILADVAPVLRDRVRFGKAKMHVPGACREIKKRYTFETYPTTHFYAGGQLVRATEGKMEPSEFRSVVESLLR